MAMGLQTSNVTIEVNGKTHTLVAGSTIAQLIEQLGMQNQRVAVEHNQDVIPRSEYPHVRLSSGDRVEIIRAIGGG